MDRNDALASLDAVRYTRVRLAERAQWPFWRHAAFGLLEGIFVFGISLPLVGMAICFVIAAAMMFWIIHDDRRRYGMFVSGWQGTKPKLVTLGLVAFAAAMAILSFSGRGDPAPAPAGLTAAVATFMACTLGSICWQKLYRRELREGKVS